MPVMDGFEATKVIRELEQQKEEVSRLIVGLSGHVEENFVDKCLRVGMNRFIAKPLNFLALEEVL